MRDDEYQYLLESDIRINGVQTPIDLDADGVTVLDGKHRPQGAARELGLNEVLFRIVQLRIDDARTFMLKAALSCGASPFGWPARDGRGQARQGELQARRRPKEPPGSTASSRRYGGRSGKVARRSVPHLAKAAETMGVPDDAGHQGSRGSVRGPDARQRGSTSER